MTTHANSAACTCNAYTILMLHVHVYTCIVHVHGCTVHVHVIILHVHVHSVVFLFLNLS